MRVTNGIIAKNTQNYIQKGMQKLARTQEMASTQKRILRPSDDPNVLSLLLNVKGSVEMNQQYMRNIQDGLSYLDAADTAMGTAGNLLQKALEYAIQGANGALAPEDMAAIGVQVDKMVDELVDIANTSVGGKYIFAGTRNARPPFDRAAGTDTITFQGNTERVFREILDQASYEIDVTSVTLPGASNMGLFGEIAAVPDPGPEDVTGGLFGTLIDLANRLKAGDVSGVENSIGEINNAVDHLLQYRVQVGARTRHFESVRGQLQDQEVRLNQVISNLEDADLAKVSIDLSQYNLSYNASLASGAQILQVSLLNFLK